MFTRNVATRYVTEISEPAGTVTSLLLVWLLLECHEYHARLEANTF